MADTRENIILQVGLDGGKVANDLADISRQIANVKKNQQDLNEQYKNGEISLAKYTEQTQSLKDEQTWLQKEQKGLIATQKLLTQTTDTYSDSLNGERQRLADMQKAYDQLDAEMRKSEGGQAFLKAIQEQDQKVKGLEESTGRAQRNVGAYADAMKKAGVGVEGFTNKLKAMLKNPLVAVFAGFVAIVQKLRDAFKRNDEAGTKLQKAFAAFKPILTMINKLFGWLADIIATIANAIAKVGSFLLSLLVPGYKEAAEAAEELADAQDRLQETERRYAVESAKRQRDIAKLRDDAAKATNGLVEVERTRLKLTREISDEMLKQIPATNQFRKAVERLKEVNGDVTKLTDEEIKQLKMLGFVEEVVQKEKVTTAELTQQAIDLETKDLEERMKIAQEKVRLQKEQMKQDDDYGDEAKDKLAQLEADLYRSESEYYGHLRKLDREQKAERERQRKEQEEQEKKSAAARLEIRRATEDKLLSLETDSTKRSVAKAIIEGKRNVENLRKKLDDLKKEDVAARAELNKLIEATEAATQKQISEILINAAKDREDTILETKREAARRGIKDSLELAKLQASEIQEDYARLQRLTDDQVLTLYGTWEKYYQALAEAETAAYDAQEALAMEQFNRDQKRRENEYNARLIGLDNEYALAELELQQKQEQYDALVAMDEETKARLYGNEEEYKAAVIAAESEIANSTANAVKTRLKSVGELGSMMNDFASALGEFAGESEAAAKAQKAFAFTGILLNQAQSISEGALAIAKGVESAAGIPFPANIPAIISITAQIGAMIAGVTSAIAQAKQIFSKSDAGNFANGGTIDGTSYTGDRLIAHVNSGEGIYTGKQANNLLQEIANNPLRGGADMDAMTAAFTAAVAALPAPKMVYSEFNDFTQEVATYNELAAI